MAITKVFLDTCILWKEDWLDPSAALISLCKTAKEGSATVIVPAVARAEHAAKWGRELRDCRSKVKKASRSLNNWVRTVGLDFDGTVDGELIDRAVAAYDEAVDATCARYEVEGIGFPTVTVETIADLSIAREAFFYADKDGNFQDCVLAFSVIEAVQTEPTGAILITDDKLFKKGPVREWMKSQAPMLKIVRSVHEASRILEKQVDEAYLASARDRASVASKTVSENRKRLEQFIRENLVLDDERFFPPGVALRSIDDLTLFSIGDIASSETSGGRVKFSIDVTVALFLTVDTVRPVAAEIGDFETVPEELETTLRVRLEADADDPDGPMEFRSARALRDYVLSAGPASPGGMASLTFPEGVDKGNLIIELQAMGSSLGTMRWWEILGGDYGAGHYGRFDVDAFVAEMKEMGSTASETWWRMTLGGSDGVSDYGGFDADAFVDEVQTMGSSAADVQWAEILGSSEPTPCSRPLIPSGSKLFPPSVRAVDTEEDV